MNKEVNIELAAWAETARSEPGVELYRARAQWGPFISDHVRDTASEWTPEEGFGSWLYVDGNCELISILQREGHRNSGWTFRLGLADGVMLSELRGWIHTT